MAWTDVLDRTRTWLRETSPGDRAVLAFLVWVGCLTPTWVVVFGERPLVALVLHSVGGFLFAGTRYVLEREGYLEY